VKPVRPGVIIYLIKTPELIKNQKIFLFFLEMLSQKQYFFVEERKYINFDNLLVKYNFAKDNLGLPH